MCAMVYLVYIHICVYTTIVNITTKRLLEQNTRICEPQHLRYIITNRGK